LRGILGGVAPANGGGWGGDKGRGGTFPRKGKKKKNNNRCRVCVAGICQYITAIWDGDFPVMEFLRLQNTWAEFSSGVGGHYVSLRYHGGGGGGGALRGGGLRASRAGLGLGAAGAFGLRTGKHF